MIVKYSDGSQYPPLPQFLRVDFQRTQGGRDYFKILEGRSAGMEASVIRKSDGESYLEDAMLGGSGGQVHFVKSTEQLFYMSNARWIGPISTTTQASNPVPVGVHELEIPDEVHPGGEPYLSKSIYAGTWFRIGHSGDRYLHPGSVSAGCVTVKDVPKWTDIYNVLIRCRMNDGKSVGMLYVFETPSDREQVLTIPWQ